MSHGQGYSGIFNPLHPFKGGNEQFVAAVVRGAGTMFIAARILNYISNDGDMKFNKPFSWVMNGKEYTFRSVPGDIYHLLSDPRSFFYYRLNPYTVRTLIEGASSRDDQGRYRDFEDQVSDILTSFTPIVLQKRGAPPSTSDSIGGKLLDWVAPTWEGLARSAGVNIFDAKTPFEKEVHTMASHKLLYSPDREESEKYKIMFQIADLQRHSILDMDSKKFEQSELLKMKFRANGVLGEEDLTTIEDMATRDHIAHRMNFLSAEEMFECMKSADFEETMKYEQQFQDKLSNLQDHHPDRYNRLMDRITERMGADWFDKIGLWAKDRYKRSTIGVALGHNIPAYQKFEGISGEGAPEPESAE